MIHFVPRSIALSTVTAVAALGLAVTTPATAEAVGICTHHGNISYDSSGKVVASAYQICIDPLQPEPIVTPDNVDILRLNVNTGIWKPVVNTVGTGAYLCKNSAPHSYRLDNGYVDISLIDAPCG